MIDPNWFNVSAPAFRSPIGRVRLWNLFRRVSTDGTWWGFGLLQIGSRHLLYVGEQGVRALFLGKTR